MLASKQRDGTTQQADRGKTQQSVRATCAKARQQQTATATCTHKRILLKRPRQESAQPVISRRSTPPTHTATWRHRQPAGSSTTDSHTHLGRLCTPNARKPPWWCCHHSPPDTPECEPQMRYASRTYVCKPSLLGSDWRCLCTRSVCSTNQAPAAATPPSSMIQAGVAKQTLGCVRVQHYTMQ
jgi:hypothetical protein